MHWVFINRRMVVDVLILDIEGRFGLGVGTWMVRTFIREWLKGGYKRVVVNLKRVRLMDSCALGQLQASCSEITARRGGLHLILPKSRRLDLAILFGLGLRFRFFTSELRAVSSL